MSNWSEPFRQRLQLLTCLPGVRRKLQNLARRSPAKRDADYRQLAETLERIGRSRSQD